MDQGLPKFPQILNFYFAPYAQSYKTPWLGQFFMVINFFIRLRKPSKGKTPFLFGIAQIGGIPPCPNWFWHFFLNNWFPPKLMYIIIIISFGGPISLSETSYMTSSMTSSQFLLSKLSFSFNFRETQNNDVFSSQKSKKCSYIACMFPNSPTEVVVSCKTWLHCTLLIALIFFMKCFWNLV